MSWSSPQHVDQDSSSHHGHALSSNAVGKVRQNLYLAVVNEADEALILHVDSPQADLESLEGLKGTDWAATVVKSATWHQIQGFLQEQEAAQPTTQPGIHLDFSLFGLSMQQSLFLDDISWGPWNGSSNEALLTLRRAGRIFHRILRLPDDASPAEFLPPQGRESLLNEESLQVNYSSPIYGPATWFQKVLPPSMADKLKAEADLPQAGTQDALHASALVSTVEVFRSNRQNELTQASCHKLESDPGSEIFWDHISGLSVCNQGEETYIYIGKVLSGLEVLHVEQDSYKKLKASPLQDRMRDLHMDWDQRNDMGGLSIMKTWGVASWGSSVASCVTFHPGDMFEYTLPKYESCVVIVCPCA
ncbi:MAG: hypothetical protein Q9167_001492 [Letrouitia subvulpina]